MEDKLCLSVWGNAANAKGKLKVNADSHARGVKQGKNNGKHYREVVVDLYLFRHRQQLFIVFIVEDHQQIYQLVSLPRHSF